jgi:hypothetical protein
MEAPDMRGPRRSHDPAGHCLPSDNRGRCEHEDHARDQKRTHDTHLGEPVEIARYQPNASAIGYTPLGLLSSRSSTATPRS